MSEADFEAGRKEGFDAGIRAAAAEVRKKYAERKTRPEWADRMAKEVEALLGTPEDRFAMGVRAAAAAIHERLVAPPGGLTGVEWAKLRITEACRSLKVTL